jgi:hypothetical protein
MYRRLAILFVVVIVAAALLLQGGITHAQQGAGTQKAPSPCCSAEQRERLEFDRQKLASDTELENKKLVIEREKLRIEGSTSKWWSPISALGPLIIALGTLIFSILSFQSQGKQQANMQLQAAKLQFEIKAAEIAFSGKTALAVLNRAKALKRIFPDRLPQDFTKAYDPEELVGVKEPSEEKKFFLELLLKYPGKQADVIDLWEKLFPGDEEWLKRVKGTSPPPP